MSLLRILSAPLLLTILVGIGCDRAPNKTTAVATKVSTSGSAGTATVVSTSSDDTPSTTTTAPTVETTFDDLKFEMEKTERFERKMLTPRVEELLGRSIRIRGYIRPGAKQRGIKHFLFLRDNLECCYGPGAALYDCILVHMEPGRTAEFSIRPVAVEGTLRLEEVVDSDGQHLLIYQMEGREVR